MAEENPEYNAGRSSRRLANTSMGSAEDVEFADELADEDDKEAQQRAAAADQRVANVGE